MSKHKELLQELEGYARSAAGVEALMAHIARRLHEEMTRYNWVGFYLADESLPSALVLGPYVGSFLPSVRASSLEEVMVAPASNSGQQFPTQRHLHHTYWSRCVQNAPAQRGDRNAFGRQSP